MEVKKNILKIFNLSYSSWSNFKQSEFQFFLNYIDKAEKTDEAIQVYGNAGNALHEALEDYINFKKETLKEKWIKYDIDNKTGIAGHKLKFDDYQKMLENGKKIIDNNKHKNIITEEKFEKEIYGINMKGFFDVIIRTDDGKIIIMDWKSNSKHSNELHEDQRLFYSWYIWKTENIIPYCEWHYLKHNVTYPLFENDRQFSVMKLKSFDEKIKRFILEIQDKGFNKDNYSLGNYKNPFNQYYITCRDEETRRLDKTKINITLEIKGHFVFLTDLIPKILEQGIDKRTKFNLQNKFFIQKYALKHNKGLVNIDDIGVMHLFNRNKKCFPIGLLPKVKKIINEYFEYYKKIGTINIIDHRDEKILNQKIELPDVFDDKKIRDYQQDAIDIFLKKKLGVIQIATGGGKTFTAGKIIKKIKAKTLWICDRKELLNQTKEALEKQLGIKIGIISGRELKICDITIATIQSLNTKISKLKDYLYNINFVIVDEFHKAAAETYQKVFAKLPNTQYRLGLTATPTRDDGKEPILFSILNEVIYTTHSQDLIKKGYLINPELCFLKYKDNPEIYEKYNEEYEYNIINNVKRNNIILDLIKKNKDKKILILTKSVKQGSIIQDNSKIKCNHIYGDLAKKEREKKYKDFVKCKKGILIITISIGSEGLDIPDLNMIINAAANKGDVKSIQILGRVLRTAVEKKSAIYYDFFDNGKWTKKHSRARVKVFENQGYKIKFINS